MVKASPWLYKPQTKRKLPREEATKSKSKGKKRVEESSSSDDTSDDEDRDVAMFIKGMRKMMRGGPRYKKRFGDMYKKDKYKKRRCYKCGEFGYYIVDCPKKKEERKELRGTLGEAADERDAAKERVGTTESRLEGLQASARGLRTDISDLETEVGEYDPEAIPDHDTVETRIAELGSEMEALEPVNMLAIDEYDRGISVCHSAWSMFKVVIVHRPVVHPPYAISTEFRFGEMG